MPSPCIHGKPALLLLWMTPSQVAALARPEVTVGSPSIRLRGALLICKHWLLLSTTSGSWASLLQWTALMRWFGGGCVPGNPSQTQQQQHADFARRPPPTNHGHRGKADLYKGVWGSWGLLDLDAQAPGLAFGYARQLLGPGTQRAVPQRAPGQVQGALQQPVGFKCCLPTCTDLLAGGSPHCRDCTCL